MIFPPEWITEKHKQIIWKLCNDIAKSLVLTEDGSMHLEILKTADDNFYVIDFSLRGGGFDLYTKIDRIVSGIDPVDLYLKAVMGENITEEIPYVASFQNIASLSFFYPDDKGYVKKINGKHLEGMHANYYLHFLYEEGEFVKKPESGSQRLAYLICWSKTRDELFNLQAEVKKSISFEVVDSL